MRRSLSLLTSVLLLAGFMGGCAKQPAVPKNTVDIEAAKKAGLPLVIYGISVFKDEKTGMTHPVINFVNTSEEVITVATYELQPHASQNSPSALWTDDYETVIPGHTNASPMLAAGWKNADIDCIAIRKLDLHIGGKNIRYFEENIAQLMQTPQLNRCP